MSTLVELILENINGIFFFLKIIYILFPFLTTTSTLNQSNFNEKNILLSYKLRLQEYVLKFPKKRFTNLESDKPVCRILLNGHQRIMFSKENG